VPFGKGNGVSRTTAAAVTPVWKDDWTPGSTDAAVKFTNDVVVLGFSRCRVASGGIALRSRAGRGAGRQGRTSRRRFKWREQCACASMAECERSDSAATTGSEVLSATAPTAKRPTMEATRRPCGRRTFLLEGVARLARLRRCHVRGDNLRARGQLFSALGAPGDIVTVPL
jgi:hypothetical protein